MTILTDISVAKIGRMILSDILSLNYYYYYYYIKTTDVD